MDFSLGLWRRPQATGEKNRLTNRATPHTILCFIMSRQTAIELPEWPQPDAGTPDPRVLADEQGVVLYYKASTGHHVLVTFPGCSTFSFGSPNDEALKGHPLYGHGLKFYSVHRVSNSDWIQEMERRNSVHPRHDKAQFLEGLIHYIITFHNSTFECLTRETRFTTTGLEIFPSFDETRDRLNALVSSKCE